MRIGYFTGKKF